MLENDEFYHYSNTSYLVITKIIMARTHQVNNNEIVSFLRFHSDCLIYATLCSADEFCSWGGACSCCWNWSVLWSWDLFKRCQCSAPYKNRTPGTFIYKIKNNIALLFI